MIMSRTLIIDRLNLIVLWWGTWNLIGLISEELHNKGFDKKIQYVLVSTISFLIMIFCCN